MRNEILRADRAARPEYEPMSMLLAEAKATRPGLAFKARTPARARAWRRLAVAAFRRALGRMPEAAPLRPRLLGKKKARGYAIEAWEVETTRGLTCPYFILVPDGVKSGAAAILCAHGHGAGVNPLLGYDRDGSRLAKEEYQKEFAVQAVRAGFVTLAHEQLAFGRRADFHWRAEYGKPKEPAEYSACIQPSMVMLQLGYTMSGMRVFEAQRMLDVLSARRDVDPRRIGMVGISGGGLTTLYTSALDTRVKAACVSGYANRFLDCIISLHHCPDNYVPGLAKALDIPDIAAMVAPRGLLIEAGSKDEWFPVAAVRKAVQKIRRAYEVCDAPKEIEVDYFDGEHQFSGRRTWEFFRRHL